MTYAAFALTVADNIAHVALDRPKQFNSLNPEFWDELPQIFDEIESRDDVRVVVLSGNGKHFCSGLDLASFGGVTGEETVEESRRREATRRHVLDLQASLARIEECRYPVLAAIQGACIGGGMDVTVCADMRYCTKDAFFSVHETNIGMTADLGTLQRLPSLIPDGMAREMIYTGRRVYGIEAKDMGYVNKVFDNHEEMIAAVMEIAREIASKSPLAVVGSKEMLKYGRDHSVADGLNFVATWASAMLTGADLREGLTAQAEKREAVYDNLVPITQSK